MKANGLSIFASGELRSSSRFDMTSESPTIVEASLVDALLGDTGVKNGLDVCDVIVSASLRARCLPVVLTCSVGGANLAEFIVMDRQMARNVQEV